MASVSGQHSTPDTGQPTMPVHKQLAGAIGQGGYFDFQRQGNDFIEPYKAISNVGVGVLMQGARFSEGVMDAAGIWYGMTHNSPLENLPSNVSLWNVGWRAANSGNYPSPVAKNGP